MKKVLIGLALLTVFSLIGGYLYGKTAPQKPDAPLVLRPSVTTIPPNATLAEIGKPQTLIIGKLNINASVESVGLDDKKNMDVPKKAQNVGWYNLGVMPGQKGNSVMAGHYDTLTGSPAVFYNLSKLRVGDLISSKDENGKEYTYKVTNIKTYPTDSFPLQEVFGPTEKYRLNLITCTGQFDNKEKNYSHRTVVYSELVE